MEGVAELVTLLAQNAYAHDVLPEGTHTEQIEWGCVHLDALLFGLYLTSFNNYSFIQGNIV